MKRIADQFWSVVSRGVPLLNRLKYARKFALIGLLASIPIGVFTYSYLSEVGHWISIAEKERAGCEYISDVQALIRDLMRHRGLSHAILKGDLTLKEQLGRTRQQLGQAMHRM